MFHHVIVLLLVLCARRSSTGFAEYETRLSLSTTPPAVALRGRSGVFSDAPDMRVWDNLLALSFAAFSSVNADIIDPMREYDPHYVRCVHRGAYLLPHPQSCEKYYVCAFGHLLLHHCGPGTIWNYKQAQCEVSAPEAVCYSNVREHHNSTTIAQVITVEPSPKGHNEKGTVSTWRQTSISTPHTEISKPTTKHMDMKTVSWIPPTPPVHLITAAAAAPSSTLPSTLFNVITRTEPAFASTPSNTVMAPHVPNCNDGTKYLADVEDCSHYFICIQSMPIGMYCPEGTFWNQQAEFCTSNSGEQCRMNK